MKILELFNQKVTVGVSELADGNMRFFGRGDEQEIIGNQHKLAEATSAEKAARIRTTYDESGRKFTDYAIIDAENISDYNITNPESSIPVSDGLATGTDYGLLLPLADCLGIVFYDPTSGALGLLHAGRHNIEHGGPKRFVALLKANFQSEPKNLLVFFSPCAQKYVIKKLGLTLSVAAEEQLLGAGVPKGHILKSAIDTVSDPNSPSNSAGDRATRFAIITKKA